MLQDTAQTQTLSLRYVKGVGPKRAEALEKKNVRTLRDLFYFFPRRYEDRSQLIPISAVTIGQTACLKAEVLKVQFKRIRRLTILDVTLGDSTGMIHAVWFNQPYLKTQFSPGQEMILYGKIDLYQSKIQLNSPEFEVIEPEEETLHIGKITPIYPLTEGLFQRSLRSTLFHAIHQLMDHEVNETLPESFRERLRLLPLKEALREMHFPASFERLAEARNRIIFDEFFIFQLRLQKKMAALKRDLKAFECPDTAKRLKHFQEKLPFQLTRGQLNSIQEIGGDLSQPVPMNRLLQGDVGSGKTVVASFALLSLAQNSAQSALLVPTEILAEQHFKTLSALLEPFKISIGLLTASTTAAKRERILAEIKTGKLSVLIGTHALLQEDVRFHRLALVIIDEQHKFGVHQRSHLLKGSPRPHQLVMTATPIPRTLALTLYGDLEISTIRELPAGRKPISTYWVTRAKQASILEHLREKMEKGEQAYFIFPVIEETEKSDLLAAEREYASLKKFFSPLKIGLIHGRLSNEEREAAMRDFKQGSLNALVATSVIEVGVDNPNATMMVIENSERFGLSQLHQMRGRIGRGEKPSECFLFGEPKTDEAKKRLRIMTKTQNGFVIAEEDLKLRGPGEFLGTKQSGAPLFKVGDPVKDEPILLQCRDLAKRLIADPTFESSPEWAPIRRWIQESVMYY